METELAKAYVQIVPSARGIKGGIGDVIGVEADAAGAKAGKSFGGKMMGSLKNIVATAAIGSAIAKTVSEGAALQQSLGGIETLFKGNADTVKAYAEQAYKTAGLSANSYMETVTGFSASLLQGLGGDTAKAAKMSDMAITDMADNSNKMGTSMESIKYAYQGFAKQQYGMLDNLKLGYGGSKTEMERLLADAQALTGVEYNIDNLSDVYSAIHEIQGELDITGTTAKEASETITGSAAAMKSAFSNVLGKLALGQDIGAELQALAQTVTTFLIGNLLPAVVNIIKALPGALVTLAQTMVPQLVAALMEFLPQLQTGLATGLPQMVQSGMQMLSSLVEGVMVALPAMAQTAALVLTDFIAALVASFPSVVQNGTQMLNSLVTGILSSLPFLVEAALVAITQFVGGIISNFPQVLESGQSVLTNIVQGIQTALPKIMLAAAEAIKTLLSGIVQHLPEIIRAGFELIASLITGIGNAYPQILDTMQQVAKSIWETIKEINWFQLGSDIVWGLIKGIGAMAGALWDAMINIAQSALGAIKSFFGIQSPSTLMRDEVGKFLPSGVAVGIEGNMNPLRKAMKEMGQVTMNPIQASLPKILSRSQMSSSTGAEPSASSNAQSTTDQSQPTTTYGRLTAPIVVQLNSREIYKEMKQVEATYGYNLGGNAYAW